MTNPYDVRTDTLCEGWINCWHIDDELETFKTIEEAQEALDEYMTGLRTSFEDDNREGFYEDCEQEQLRIFHIPKVCSCALQFHHGHPANAKDTGNSRYHLLQSLRSASRPFNSSPARSSGNSSIA